MKNSEILIQITDALDDWASDYGGSAEFAGDAGHLFAILSAKPGGVRAAVWMRSEKKRGEYEETGIVDRTIHVIISRARGFRIEKSETHILTTPSGPPLIDLVEEARDLLRGLDFELDETEWTLDYKGFEPFTFRPDDKPLDAYDLEFSLGCQLPVPSIQMSTKGLYATLATDFTLAPAAHATFAPTTEVYDDFAGYAAGTFTVPATGLWLVEVHGAINAGTGGHFRVRIVINGVFQGENIFPVVSGQIGEEIRYATVVKATKGDALLVDIYRSDDGTASVAVGGYLKIHPL